METDSIRTLTAECRQAGVFVEDLPEELRRIRVLVEDRQLDSALEHARELRVDLLGRLLLKEPEPIPPSPVENPPPAGSLSEAELAAINARIVEKLAPPARPKPPSRPGGT